MTSRVTRRSFIRRAGAFAGSAVAYQALPVGRLVYASTSDSGLPFLSALELSALIRDRKIGSVELTRLFIDRIERYDKTLNAVVVRDFDRAIEAARAADESQARGELKGPFHGLPMTIKEAYDIAGLPTTWGVPDWIDNVPVRDAETVRRYKAAGAHFMGKTNVPLMLGDFQSYNDIYGTTNNPWNPERVPGGSSGGSAAALAAGLTGLESGSDIGGSIRNPSHFCGVYGHKPTWGIVSMRGQAPPGAVARPDLAVVGPMGRSALDLKAGLGIVAGADHLNAAGWRLELPPPRMSTLGELRVALIPDHGVMPVSREVADRVAAIGEVLVGRGAKVSDTARPEFLGGEAFGVYMSMLSAIMGFSKLDYGEYRRLDNQRTYYRMGWQEFFRDWDVLVCPISPTTAFPHDQSAREGRTIQVNGEPQPYDNQLFWAGIATLSYLPSTVFPTGPSADGLPIGLQAIGAEFDDETTIAFAHLMAEEIGGFVPPPGY